MTSTQAPPAGAQADPMAVFTTTLALYEYALNVMIDERIFIQTPQFRTSFEPPSVLSEIDVQMLCDAALANAMTRPYEYIHSILNQTPNTHSGHISRYAAGMYICGRAAEATQLPTSSVLNCVMNTTIKKMVGYIGGSISSPMQQ